MNTSTQDLSTLRLLKLFNYRCLICLRKAVTLHEIVPKSKRPKDWMEDENRVPVCARCHDMIHADGSAVWRDKLTEFRRKRLHDKGL